MRTKPLQKRYTIMKPTIDRNKQHTMDNITSTILSVLFWLCAQRIVGNGSGLLLLSLATPCFLVGQKKALLGLFKLCEPLMLCYVLLIYWEIEKHRIIYVYIYTWKGLAQRIRTEESMCEEHMWTQSNTHIYTQHKYMFIKWQGSTNATLDWVCHRLKCGDSISAFSPCILTFAIWMIDWLVNPNHCPHPFQSIHNARSP